MSWNIVLLLHCKQKESSDIIDANYGNTYVQNVSG